MVRRKSPDDKDFERIAESLAQLDYKNKIKNRDDFNNALSEYMGTNGENILKNEKSVDKIFNSFVFNNPQKITTPDAINETKPLNTETKLKIKRDYRYLGRSGKRIVYLRKSNEYRDGQKVIIYRDRNGHLGVPKFKDEE